jgi:uncharacterized protein (TIGR02996 family)
MSTRDQLLADLCRAPEDWKLRGVLADWCEDNDHAEAAACLRWMIRHQKRPYHGAPRGATWFNADTISPGLGDPQSDLPGELFERLEGGKEVAHHKSFTTVRDAEESILAAWASARQAGWRPAG